jgi:hypothetical protein
MNVEITEKEILDTPNDQDLGLLVRLKYYEIKSIKNAGGLVIRVQRGPDPDWFVNTTDYFNGKCDLPDNLPHASEWSWAGTEFDAVLDNNGTMDNLFQQVNDLVQDHQVSRVAQAA